MRVLYVSHSCVLRESQKPLLHLHGAGDVEVALVAPTKWRTNLHGLVRFSVDPEFSGTTFPPAHLRTG